MYCIVTEAGGAEGAAHTPERWEGGNGYHIYLFITSTPGPMVSVAIDVGWVCIRKKLVQLARGVRDTLARRARLI